MVELGVKWSAIAGSAVSLVDVVEVDGWMLGATFPDRPLLLHNLDLDFSLAAPGIVDHVWVERCTAAIERVGAPWFSVHLGFSAAEVRFQNHMLPASPVLDRATCFERVVAALSFAREHLPVPLLVENLDYCPEGAYEHVCDPEFISSVVSESGCGLLLDLAHLQVSADWLGHDPRDYAERLPLDRVVEVHLSSPRRIGARLDDCHMHLVDRDYDLLDWLLTRCRPRAVVLEYRREESRLVEQLERLRAQLDRT